MTTPPASTGSLFDAVTSVFSAFQPYREYASTCSYCRRPGNKTRIAYGCTTMRISAVDYETLSERGWIRSGRHVYVPENERSCCPNIPIRLDAVQFTPTKSHIKLLRRIQAFMGAPTHTHAHGHARTSEHPADASGPAAASAPAPRIVLPVAPAGQTTDVLEALLRLAETGAGERACASVCVHREDGNVADDDSVIEDVEAHEHDAARLDAAEEDAAAHAHAHTLMLDHIRGGLQACVRACMLQLAETDALVEPMPIDTLMGRVKFELHAASAPGNASKRPRVEAHGDSASSAGSSVGCFIHCNAAHVYSAWALGVSPPPAGLDRKAVHARIAQHQQRTAEQLLARMTGAGIPFRWLNLCVKHGAQLHFIADETSWEYRSLMTEWLNTARTVRATEAHAALGAAWNVDAETGLPRLASGKLLTCLNAQTPHEWRVLRAHYRAIQTKRGEAGARAFLADASIPRIRDDDDGLSSDDGDETGDDAELDATPAEAASAARCDATQPAVDTSGLAAPLPRLTRAQRKEKKRTERLASEIEESKQALQQYLEDGVGSHERKLRRAAVPVPAERAQEVLAAAGYKALQPGREPPVDGLTHAVTGAVLPFGDAPVRFTVTLRRPEYSTEAHELYARFNMTLHRGRPRDNTRAAFTRHLVSSPIMPMHSQRLGFWYACATNTVEEWYGTCIGQPNIANAEQMTIAPMQAHLADVATKLGIPDLAPDHDAIASQVLASMALEDGVTAFVLDAIKNIVPSRPLLVGSSAAPMAAVPRDDTVGFLPCIALPSVFTMLLQQTASIAQFLGVAPAAVLLACFMLVEDIMKQAAAVLSLQEAAFELAAAVVAAADAAGSVADVEHMPEHMERQAAAAAAQQSCETALEKLQTALTLESLFDALQDVVHANGGRLRWWNDAVTSLLHEVQNTVIRYSPSRVSVPSVSSTSPARGPVALEPFFARSKPSAGAPADAAAAPRILVDGWDLGMGFGTFFHEYRINDTLVAISVLDILPTRVASVYFFYNPDLRYLQLGKLSALTEIWLTQQIYQHTAEHPEILGLGAELAPLCRWWDANFYVHMCATMSYKNQFRPSQLLCPYTKNHAWVDLTDAVLRKLDADPAPPLTDLFVTAPDGSRVAADAHTHKLVAQQRRQSEALFAAAIVPRILVQLKSRCYSLGALTGTSQQMLSGGYAKFVQMVGTDVATRCVTDPDWVASLHTQAEEYREDKRKAKELREARARAREGELAASAT